MWGAPWEEVASSDLNLTGPRGKGGGEGRRREKEEHHKGPEQTSSRASRSIPVCTREGGEKFGYSHGSCGEAMCLRSVAAQDEEGR